MIGIVRGTIPRSHCFSYFQVSGESELFSQIVIPCNVMRVLKVFQQPHCEGLMRFLYIYIYIYLSKNHILIIIHSAFSNNSTNSNNTWLVVWLPFFMFPYIGLLITPIDELIFFRGVAQPPTRYNRVLISFTSSGKAPRKRGPDLHPMDSRSRAPGAWSSARSGCGSSWSGRWARCTRMGRLFGGRSRGNL